MFKSKKGFTLIELLIVVAIIGILAALLIPNAITAMQKAKQKASMKDIVTISTALTDHVTDHGICPPQSGTYVSGDVFYLTLSPFYVKVLPTRDKWAGLYFVYTGDASLGQYGTNDPDPGDDSFIVASHGRNKTPGPTYVFLPGDPEGGLYEVTNMQSFDEDLIMWDGNWIVAPRTYSLT
jgi:prepilin-type N-terminal cleavage/methylation domain-containing protein